MRLTLTAIAASAATLLLVSAPSAGAATASAAPTCTEAQAAVDAADRGAHKAQKQVRKAKNRLRAANKRGSAKPRRARQRLRKGLRRARKRLGKARKRLGDASSTARTVCAGPLSPAPAPAPANLLVVLGSSLVPYYAPGLQSLYATTHGVTQLSERSAPGTTSTGLLAGPAWSGALADINAASDTRVVAMDVGGWDAVSGGCDDKFHLPSCPVRRNLARILSRLQSALAGDPGEELLVAMAYYNPGSGLMNATEADYDDKLLGDDLALSCDAGGTLLGLNDVIAEEARDAGVPLANPYPAFKMGGQAFMSDPLHPSPAGSAAIVSAFQAASAPCA